MFRDLPSLTSLRAFEAAARLRSLKAAAAELGVTPAAVGAQVQALEDRLGLTLFKREHRRITPTAAALQLQAACNRALAEMTEGIRELGESEQGIVLTVGVGTLFGSRWLSPRLSGFWQCHPEIALRLVHTPDLTQPITLDVDAVIAWGDGKWPDSETHLVLRPHLVPVASPSYLAQYGTPQSLQDLQSQKLVEEVGTSWDGWLAEHGLRPAAHRAITTVRDGALALQLALDGQAIVLGVEEFLKAEFSSGELKPLFTPRSSRNGSYYLLVSKRGRINVTLAAFRDWILREAEVHPTDR